MTQHTRTPKPPKPTNPHPPTTTQTPTPTTQPQPFADYRPDVGGGVVVDDADGGVDDVGLLDGGVYRRGLGVEVPRAVREAQRVALSLDSRGRQTARVPARRHKANQAIALRMAGLTYDEIADSLGYAEARSVRDVIRSELAKTCEESADELRALSARRLDWLLGSVWAIASDDSHPYHFQARSQALEIIDRQNKLAGLNKEQRGSANATTNVVVVAGSTDDYTAQLKQLAIDTETTQP